MYIAIDDDYKTLATIHWRCGGRWVNSIGRFDSISDATHAVRALYRNADNPRLNRPYKWVRAYWGKPVPSLGRRN